MERMIVQHLRTDVNGKKPLPRSIMTGELAINYAANGETLFIKNTEEAIAEFKDNKYYQKQLSEKADKTYVDNSIADLVDGAPETLDTLKELAAALNNNADIVDVLNQSISSKQDKLVSGTNIKTINGESIVGSGDMIIENSILPLTYSELVSLRDNSQLIPGQQYRITDYTCTTTQEGTQSAGHQFDIIVKADSENKLNEEANAIQHTKDDIDYFANSDLSAWRLWYCLDNDATRFAWADETETDGKPNGRGVIYRMIDEFGNDCPYDFKNIQFYRKWDENKQLWSTISSDNTGVPCYTFSSSGDSATTLFTDTSLLASNSIYSNVIGKYVSNNKQTLNNICFFGNECYSNTFGDNCSNNTFGEGCSRNTFGTYYSKNIFLNGCSRNIIGNSSYDNFFGENCCGNIFRNNCSNNILRSTCNYNTFGNNCYNNAFGNNSGSNTFGNDCNQNTVRNNCYSNTFGNICYSNTFEDDCSNNTFGEGCSRNTFGGNCKGNTFGNICKSNTFGNYCQYNTFGNGCYYNTFGNNCYSNTFGNECYSNTFGNGFRYNTFGNICYSNTFGNYCSSNTFGNSCQHIKFASDSSAATKYNYYQYNHFGDGCAYLVFKGTETASSSAQVQNYNFAQGLQGASSAYLTIDGKRNRTYETYISKDTDGTIKESVIAEKLDKVIEISYNDLVTLRGSSKLVPGQQYRITDYQCTTSQSGTKSAGHIFDIIVTADDESTLNEEARAVKHEGDTYFANNDLSAWQIWYCLDNDANRFAWADSANGKGVIYRMIDEFNNDAPYDFKNIQFYRKWDATKSLWSTISSDNTGVPCYTFSSSGNSTTTSFTDMSLLASNSIYSNVIGKDVSSNRQTLNNICFFGDYCYSNTFGNNCSSNTFGFWFHNNTFGDNCSNNIFGDNCYLNTFGNECSNNTSKDDFINNTFGNLCGTDIYGHTLGNTFRNGCQSNSFGNNCYSNTFGSHFNFNSFGNYCSNIKFASDSSASTKYSYYQHNHFGDSCKYIVFKGGNTGSQYVQVQNYNFAQGLQGTSSEYLTINGVRDRSFETKVAKNSNGELKIYCEADLIL